MQHSQLNNTSSEVQEYRRLQLRLLDELKKICDRHNLTYWLNFGTLLGALRYKSYIPWDDDIDVSMMMPDYKKFLEIAEKELPKDIFLQTPKTDPAYKQAFAKLRDCNSTFLEHTETGNEKYHTGIYIDIFPFIEYPIMPKILHKALLHFSVPSRDLAVIRGKNKIKNYTIYGICKFVWILFSPFKSGKFGRTHEDNGYYELIPYESIIPVKQIEFEGKMYSAPNDPAASMSSMYGPDFMTPPPPEKRIPHAKTILPHTPCNHPRAVKK